MFRNDGGLPGFSYSSSLESCSSDDSVFSAAEAFFYMTLARVAASVTPTERAFRLLVCKFIMPPLIMKRMESEKFQCFRGLMQLAL